jgi:hypothetical protein
LHKLKNKLIQMDHKWSNMNSDENGYVLM